PRLPAALAITAVLMAVTRFPRLPAALAITAVLMAVTPECDLPGFLTGQTAGPPSGSGTMTWCAPRSSRR
ncbi:MAG TPA: hypothetical protein VMS16_02800, partial [Mycobacterium sp.]|nr:hypothetical protein [Mycobacterium sp.]